MKIIKKMSKCKHQWINDYDTPILSPYQKEIPVVCIKCGKKSYKNYE